MAKHLRVSRSSVRDAIRRLEVIAPLEARRAQGCHCV
jgi:DNA-binding FadR family transcriptional regulator